MKLKELKELINFLKDLDFEKDHLKEVLEAIENEEIDFEVNNYRFINSDNIDEIQQEELLSDTYILGCFNAGFLADIINVPYKAIKALQKANCYSELGEICEDYIQEIQKEYARLGGYEHHFGRYDGKEHELNINGQLFHVFRVN
jgi:GTPase SAR1 family protein